MSDTDFDDYDNDSEDEQLFTEMAAQLARWEERNGTREQNRKNRQHRALKTRRELEEWDVRRRMRDEIDYL